MSVISAIVLLHDSMGAGAARSLISRPAVRSRDKSPSSAMATILAMETRPLADVKNHLSELVDRVARERDRVAISRNGRLAAVLISPDDLESLEETLAILGDTNEMAALREGLADLAHGRTESLEQLERETKS